MEGKLVRWGDDLVVRIAPEDARELGLHEGQTVEVRPKTPRAAFAEMIAEMDRLGPAHRPPLVDFGQDVGAEIVRDDG